MLKYIKGKLREVEITPGRGFYIRDSQDKSIARGMSYTDGTFGNNSGWSGYASFINEREKQKR